MKVPKRTGPFLSIRNGGTGALVLASGAVLLLLMPVAPAQATAFALGGPSIGTGGSATAPGKLAHCPSGIVLPQSAYLCLRALATSTSGSAYARGWAQLEMNTTRSGLSGTHSFFEKGKLNLTAGYAQLSLSCSVNGTAYGRVYIFYHVWVWDQTAGNFASQSNSGYIWDSGYYYCPSNGASLNVKSPRLQTSFNTAFLPSTGSTSLTFAAGHTYVFILFVGCTAEASSGPASVYSHAASYCNFQKSTGNTMTLSSLGIV